MRASSKTMAAVSLARMPCLISVLVTVTPGVPASTTNGRIPARPALRSIDAQTTTNPFDSSSASLPLVQKIFSPLSTHSLVASSNTALVRIAEVSDPAPGSVIAIAPHAGVSPSAKRDRNLIFCSGVPTASIAAPPSAPPGRHR